MAQKRLRKIGCWTNQGTALQEARCSSVVSGTRDNFVHGPLVSSAPPFEPCFSEERSTYVHQDVAIFTNSVMRRPTAHVWRNRAIVEESSAASIARDVLKFFKEVQRCSKVKPHH